MITIKQVADHLFLEIDGVTRILPWAEAMQLAKSLNVICAQHARREREQEKTPA